MGICISKPHVAPAEVRPSATQNSKPLDEPSHSAPASPAPHAMEGDKQTRSAAQPTTYGPIRRRASSATRKPKASPRYASADSDSYSSIIFPDTGTQTHHAHTPSAYHQTYSAPVWHTPTSYSGGHHGYSSGNDGGGGGGSCGGGGGGGSCGGGGSY